MNDPMETEEVGLGYNYTPMALGMLNNNVSNYDFPPQPNFDFFSNLKDLEAENRHHQAQFSNYYGNDSLIYSEPSLLSKIHHPKKTETKPRKTRAFENWEDDFQQMSSPRPTIPFKAYNPPLQETQENNIQNNSFAQLISDSKQEKKQTEPNLDQESDWYQDELWEGASHGSFEQNHNNANIESPLSSQLGEELPSQCDLMVLNEISSIIDPLDKDLNDSETSEPCDREPFEKKRKIEDFVSKEKIDLPGDTKHQKDWEHDIPGRILCGIKRGCRYYFTRCRGIRLQSVLHVLDNKMIESQKKFEKFIVRYKSIFKTWEDITTYVSDEGDNEIAWLLMELISEFLTNKEDVEIWLANTKMSEKTKTRIRANKGILKESFILHFYPISQSWVKSVY